VVLSARIGSLAAMAPLEGARALIGAHILARWSSLPLMLMLPYARREGVGTPFMGAMTRPSVLLGTLLAALLVAGALGRCALPVVLAAAITTAIAGWYFRNRLGGITGDCLGATNQLVELATFLAVLA
jgi:adenosylcobinamide-GDP ribazoletransferase